MYVVFCGGISPCIRCNKDVYICMSSRLKSVWRSIMRGRSDDCFFLLLLEKAPRSVRRSWHLYDICVLTTGEHRRRRRWLAVSTSRICQNVNIYFWCSLRLICVDGIGHRAQFLVLFMCAELRASPPRYRKSDVEYTCFCSRCIVGNVTRRRRMRARSDVFGHRAWRPTLSVRSQREVTFRPKDAEFRSLGAHTTQHTKAQTKMYQMQPRQTDANEINLHKLLGFSSPSCLCVLGSYGWRAWPSIGHII